MLGEVRRVLKPGGFTLLSIPNLGSWNNRIALLLGYQPRDVEISDRSVVGVFPYYRDRTPTGHIHTPTLKALTELMDIHGFDQFRGHGGIVDYARCIGAARHVGPAICPEVFIGEAVLLRGVEKRTNHPRVLTRVVARTGYAEPRA